MDPSARHNTVCVAELRRVLANTPTGSSGAQRPSLTTAFPSAPTTRPRSTTTSGPDGRTSSSPASSPSGSPSSSPGCSSPLTGAYPPPPTAFDVRTAAETCRRIEGYVHFMDVAGLGAPPGVSDDDAARDADHRRWSWERFERFFGAAQPSAPAPKPAKP